ncbi:protein mono-ADP-ribosyltransferase PARP14 isoform X2 [Brachyhypopomus gauderio]|uniref:protein mono-ADP-ribosyltransferase PARP14 isoform X2 n=1 Tax=Brachyhypopomus gauderio TaxID=698409 RepID=UPI004042D844
MAEYPFLLTVEADWPSTSAKTIAAKLQIYFQSKKKSQGGDCVVHYPDQSGSATVHFRSPETRNNVLAKGAHALTINERALVLTVREPTDGRTEKALKSSEAGTEVARDFQQTVPGAQTSSSVKVCHLPPDAITNRDLLELFFQKWGGPVKTISTIPEEHAAIITFHTQDALQKILDRTIYTICGSPVKVQQFPDVEVNQNTTKADAPLKGRSQDAPRSTAVLLENIPRHLTRDVLMLLVENISGLGEEEFLLELIFESNIAVVTFSGIAVAERFLKESRTNKKFQGYGLRAQVLENSRSVRVENLNAQSNNTDLLELYFEKWVGKVLRVDTLPKEKAAIITFDNSEAVETVLRKEHNIGNTSINVYPYFKSLGVALYGKDRPSWMLPKPFTEKLHPSIRLFLHKMGLTSAVCDQMASHFCLVNMDSDDVLLSPLPGLLRQKNLTRKDIDSWRSNTRDRFRDILSNYDVFEHAVIPSLRGTVEKDIRSVVKDKAVLNMDASTGVLTLAGMQQDIKILKPILEDFLRKASSQMERDQNSSSDTMEMSQAIFSLLLHDGLQTRAATKFPDLKLIYKKDDNQLTLLGLHVEIVEVKNWILQWRLTVTQKVLQIDPSLVEFLRSVDCEEMSRDLFTSKGLGAFYTVKQEGVELTGSSDKMLTEAEKRLETTLAFHNLHLQDHSLMDNLQLSTLIAQLCDTYNLSRKKTVLIKPSKQRNSLLVSGFKEPVTEVIKTLEEFIDTHSRTEEAIRVRSHAVVQFIKEKSQSWQNLVNVKIDFDPKRPLIKVSGERGHVSLAMESFQKIAESLYSDKIIICKAGAKKYFQEQGKMFLMMLKDRRLVIVLEEGYMMDENKDDYDDNGTKDLGQVFCEVQMPGEVVITVRKADICQFKVDAVVNAANEDLKHIGGVALALLTAAGPCLQDDCDRYVAANGPVQPGRAITTDAGRLPCKYVVHAVGPRYSPAEKITAVRRLQQAVRESLDQAVFNRCSSIAIPVISSGVFGFPLELCTETIAKELGAYVKGQTHQGGLMTLREIHMVDNNVSTVRAMAQAVRKEFASFNPKMTFSQQAGSHRRGNNSRGHRGQIYRGAQGNQEKSYHGPHARGHGRREFGSRVEEPRFYRGNESMGFEHQEQSSRQYSSPQSGDFNRSALLETQSTPEGVRIILRKGNIQDALSDVIVNTISEDLDLSKGAVSKALVQAAGPQLQAEVKTHVSKSGFSHLNYGDIVDTDGYNLKCQRVFHTVCPFWKGGSNSEDEVLKEIIANCLKKADNQKMASISFPAIGTGNLGFPRGLVSGVLRSQIYSFSAQVTPQYLQEVTVVVHPSDDETVQCFIRTFRGGYQDPVPRGAHAIRQSPGRSPTDPARSSQSSGVFGAVSTPTLGVHSVQVGNLTLEVSSGDITREKSDAIVNSSNQTFSLKSGVSKAILEGAGMTVELECAQIVNSGRRQPQDMIVTSGGQLPCRNIIHVTGRNLPADIKEAVYRVLKLCEEKRFSSVSFPALGTGQGGVSASAVADAMIDAVVDFVKKKKVEHVRSVKFMVFQTSMLPEFHQSMLRKQQGGAREDNTVMEWIKDKFDTVASFFLGDSVERPVEDFVMVGEEFEPAVFQLCGETPQDVSEARDLITRFIVKEQTSSTIRDSAIGYFTQEDADALRSLQRELTVSIRLVKSEAEPAVSVEGLTRDVVTAEGQIRDMIRKAEKNEIRRREAFLLINIVEWQYRDSKNNMQSFDLLTNYELEDAFKRKIPHIKIRIGDEQYDADLILKKAVGRGRQFKLKRTDHRETPSVSLPKHWDDMKGSFLLEVQLQEGTQEFTHVEKEFRKTGLTYKILDIKRIQNSTLWSNYTIQKNHLDAKNQNTNNEKLLFHGTATDNIDKINTRGFNRSYAGTNGALYGNGVYFAVDPTYSAQGYSKPDAQGLMRMFLARVLVGEFTRGKKGLLSPPTKSGSTTDLYDSVTDNEANPSMFVIFHDVHAYPEYLITFQ